MSSPLEILKSELDYKDGILTHKGARVVIVPFEWLVNLQKEIENIIGSDGAYVLIQKAGRKGGEGVAALIDKIFAGAPIEEKIRMYLQTATMTGWGKITLEKIELEPLEVKLKYEHSYVEGHYQNESEGKCYYVSTVVSVIESLLKNKGFTGELVSEETKCVAKGDPYCEFVIKEAHN